MSSWLNHPRFKPVRDYVLSAFERKEYHFRKAKSVIFLCGAKNSVPRQNLADYLSTHRENAIVFFADNVWGYLASQEDQNALEMETQLARLADMVCVIVESPGTMAELGAFSNNEELRRKLLPILDKQFQIDKSFINSGPVTWIDTDSVFAPSIWTTPSVILDCLPEIEDRLSRIDVSEPPKVSNIQVEEKYLLFLLCDLITVMGPCSLEDLNFYVSRISPGTDTSTIDRLVSLGLTLEMLESTSASRETRFSRQMRRDHYPSLQVTNYYQLPMLRAKVLDALQGIPNARAFLAGK
jgi:hypothetical protein